MKYLVDLQIELGLVQYAHAVVPSLEESFFFLDLKESISALEYPKYQSLTQWECVDGLSGSCYLLLTWV